MLADRKVGGRPTPLRLGSAVIAAVLAAAAFAVSAGEASAAPAQATRLALAMPLTVPAQETGLISAELLESYTSPTGLLTRQLDAMSGRPVTIGIDPMIIASIRILGTSAPESATAWLDRLGTIGNETFSLTYADSDVAALRQAGSGGVLAPTSFPINPDLFPDAPQQTNGDNSDTQTEAPNPAPTGTPEPDRSGVPTSATLLQWPYTLDSIVWPRDGSVVSADLDAFNAAGPVTTILGSGNVTVEDAGAHIAASATVGTHASLISDGALSTLLTQAVSALTDAEWQTAMAQLSAALSELDADPAATPSTVLATVHRNSTVGSPRLTETLNAIAAVPGLQFAGLTTAMAETAEEAALVEAPADPARVAELAAMLAVENQVAQFATIMEDASPITGERRLSLLAMASNTWLDASANRPEAVSDWMTQSNDILTSVEISESSTINLLSDTGDLPITVSNELDYPVTVYVSVSSETGIVVVLEPRVPIIVEANSQGRVLVPVQSVANGEATLAVSLSSQQGIPISTPMLVTTNVQAGWETALTFVLAGLLLGVFATGVARTIMRRRRRRTDDRDPASVKSDE
ncbi:MAG: hypothetical protein JWP30_1769 [Homoserinimonas sp.]|jgi:hypothetical protein|nr:hypothetical protein [Homoserinimonas sp.]